MLSQTVTMEMKKNRGSWTKSYARNRTPILWAPVTGIGRNLKFLRKKSNFYHIGTGYWNRPEFIGPVLEIEL